MLKNKGGGLGRATVAGSFALVAFACPLAADETDAKAILAAMSDFMTNQQSFAFDFDATLEVVTTDDQKIGLASSGTVAVARPGQIHATRQGGYANLEMGYDGTTVTLIGHEAGVYTQVALDGAIDSMVDTLRDEHNVVLPAADLLMSDPAAVLMDGVTDVKDLGIGVIGGQVCDHIALRNAELDIQIWIAEGDEPYPCRYVLSAREVAQQPQYSVQISNWHTELGEDAFSVSLPEGLKEVDIGDLAALSQELPENFTTGATK